MDILSGLLGGLQQFLAMHLTATVIVLIGYVGAGLLHALFTWKSPEDLQARADTNPVGHLLITLLGLVGLNFRGIADAISAFFDTLSKQKAEAKKPTSKMPPAGGALVFVGALAILAASTQQACTPQQGAKTINDLENVALCVLGFPFTDSAQVITFCNVAKELEPFVLDLLAAKKAAADRAAKSGVCAPTSQVSIDDAGPVTKYRDAYVDGGK